MPSLVVLVLSNLSKFEEVLSAWHEPGADAVTVVDSVGTRAATEKARRQDLPLLPRIRDLLQSDDAPRKTVFTIVADDDAVDRLAKATAGVVGDLKEPGNGVLFQVPITRVIGLDSS